MGILDISGLGEMAHGGITHQIPFLSGWPERVMKWTLRVAGDILA